MQTGTLRWTAGVYTRYYRMMCVFAASIRRFGHEIHQSRFINRSQLPMAISGVYQLAGLFGKIATGGGADSFATRGLTLAQRHAGSLLSGWRVLWPAHASSRLRKYPAVARWKV